MPVAKARGVVGLSPTSGNILLARRCEWNGSG